MPGFDLEVYHAFVKNLKEQKLAQFDFLITTYLMVNLNTPNPLPLYLLCGQLLILTDGEEKHPVLKIYPDLKDENFKTFEKLKLDENTYLGVPIIKKDGDWTLDCENPVAIKQNEETKPVSEESFEEIVKEKKSEGVSCPALWFLGKSYIQVPLPPDVLQTLKDNDRPANKKLSTPINGSMAIIKTLMQARQVAPEKTLESDKKEANQLPPQRDSVPSTPRPTDQTGKRQKKDSLRALKEVSEEILRTNKTPEKQSQFATDSSALHVSPSKKTEKPFAQKLLGFDNTE